MPNTDYLEALLKAANSGSLVIVIGAGVSKAVADIPAWRAAVGQAINHIAMRDLTEVAEIDALRNELEAAERSEDLIAVASLVRAVLVGNSFSSGEFAAWLEAAFKTDPNNISDPRLLRVIRQIPEALLVTTNYDDLLSVSRIGSRSITWQDSGQLARALHDATILVHAHGVWYHPETVIFGSEEYDVVSRDDASRDFWKTLWLDRTILFVGCSLDGLSDPDFSRFLDSLAETFPDATHCHYALVRSNTLQPADKARLLTRWRIQAIEFGESYDALPAFLEQLTRSGASEPPAPPRIFLGRDAIKVDISQAIDSNQTVLVHGMGGIGKSTLMASVLQDRRLASPNEPQLWIEHTVDSAISLTRILARQLGISGYQLLAEDELLPLIRSEVEGLGAPVIVFDTDAPSDAVALIEDLNGPTAKFVGVSRTRSRGFTVNFEVERLDHDAGTALFTAVSGVAAEANGTVSEIVEVLEGHPLAITVAASKHAVEGTPIDRILANIQQETNRLGWLTADDLESPQTSVRASLNVSLRALSDQLLSALSLATYLGPELSVNLLAVALATDEVECERTMGQWIRRSLASWAHGDHVRFHQLVRDAVAATGVRTEDQLRVSATGTFQRLMDSEFVSSERQRRILVENTEPVAKFILETTTEDDLDRRSLAVGLTLLLFEPHGLAELYLVERQMIGISQRVVEKADELVGDIPVAELRIGLIRCRAAIFAARGRIDEAIGQLEEALTLAGELNAPSDFFSLIRAEYGNMLVRKFRLREAEAMMRRGLQDANASGSQIAIAQLNGQLGHVLLERGKLPEAKNHYQTAMAGYAPLGANIGVAACLHNLARIADKEGNAPEAWDLAKQSYDREVMEDHIAGALNSLEFLASHAITEAKAEWVCAQIDEIVSRAPAATLQGNPGLASGLKAMAWTMAGEITRARELRAENIREKEAAGDILGLAKSWGNFVALELAMDDSRAALAANARSTDLYVQVGDLQGARKCLHNAIFLHASIGEWEDAIASGCEAIDLAIGYGDMGGASISLMTLVELVLEPNGIPIPLRMLSGDPNRSTLIAIARQAAKDRDLAGLFGTLPKLATDTEAQS